LLSVSVLYTIEFQKRGLPHVHILLWLEGNSRDPRPSFIDSIIIADIPDRVSDPLGYSLVDEFMVHGPCGELNKKCPCMKNNKCSKFFPKAYQQSTIVGEDGFVQYRRPESSSYVERYGVRLDSGWVVPYNLSLLKRFRAHINVEWCNKTHLIKYLFKYVTKGPDRARAVIESFDNDTHAGPSQQHPVGNDGTTQPQVDTQKKDDEIDEVREYIDCRYLSSHEAVCSSLIYIIGHPQ